MVCRLKLRKQDRATGRNTNSYVPLWVSYPEAYCWCLSIAKNYCGRKPKRSTKPRPVLAKLCSRASFPCACTAHGPENDCAPRLDRAVLATGTHTLFRVEYMVSGLMKAFIVSAQTGGEAIGKTHAMRITLEMPLYSVLHHSFLVLREIIQTVHTFGKTEHTPHAKYLTNIWSTLRGRCACRGQLAGSSQPSWNQLVSMWMCAHPSHCASKPCARDLYAANACQAYK